MFLMAGGSTSKEQPQEVKEKAPKLSGSKSRVKLIVIGCVVVLALVFCVVFAGAAYAYTSNKNVPVFSSIVESSENLVTTKDQRAEVVQDDMNDFIFSTVLSIKNSESMAQYINVTATEEEINSHIVDKQELNSFKYDGSLAMTSEGADVSVDVNGIYNKTNMSAVLDGQLKSNEVTVDFSGEIRSFSDMTYLKVDELPSELLGTTEADSFQGQWFSMDNSTLTQFGSSLSSSYGVPAETASAGLTLSNDDLNKIEEFIYSDAVGDTIVRTDDEVIEGVRTNCFEMDLDKTEMKAMLKKAGELKDIEFTEADLDNSVAGMERLKLNICTGRKDGQIYKFALEVSIPAEQGSTVVSMDMKLWDQNKTDDKLDRPADAQPLEDILQQYSSALSENFSDVAGASTDKADTSSDADVPENWKDFDWEDYDLEEK